MRKVSTLGLNQRVSDAARKISEIKLQGKLSEGDMIALDAVYHLACLSSLYRKADAVDHGSSESHSVKIIKAQTFEELIDYIEDHRGSGTVLSMAKLTALYDKCLASLGYPHRCGHTTRLCQYIVSMVPDIKDIERSSGYWDLVFNEDLSQAVEEM